MRLRALSGILIVWGTALLLGHLANAAATAHAVHRPLAGDGVLIAAVAALVTGILVAAVAFAQPAGLRMRLGSAHRLAATFGSSLSESHIAAWRPPRRAAVVAVALASLVLTAIYTLYVLVYTGLGTCGGDGGTPHADSGSVAAWYCNNTAAQAFDAALTFATPAVLITGATLAIRRKTWSPLAIALMIAPALLLIYATPTLLY